MQVLFVGGASGVGASCLAVDVGGAWIVIDAGLRTGSPGNDPLPDLAQLEGKAVVAILVTHAHADHIGAFPLLSRAFPTAPVYASRATCLLMESMLVDTLNVAARRARQRQDLPLYGERQVARLLERLRWLPVGREVVLPELPQVALYASWAGHIAGALSFAIRAPQGTVVISGDLSMTNQRTVAAAVPPPVVRPDLLILESTYGRTPVHPHRHMEEQRLAQAVAAGIARGGHVLIPCFGLGRGQEVLLTLKAAQHCGQIPAFPIYVDGLVREICALYARIPEALTSALASQIRRGDPSFGGRSIRFVQAPWQRHHVLSGRAACIIASSGMLTGGPSAWYASHLVGQPTASLLLTGYQDEESPGKHLLEVATGARNTLCLDGVEHEVRCHVGQYALSAHASASELTTYVTHLAPRRVALVHGDPPARHALARQLARQTSVVLPAEGEATRSAPGCTATALHPDAAITCVHTSTRRNGALFFS